MKNKEILVNLKIKNAQNKDMIISRFIKDSPYSKDIINAVKNVETSFYFISEIKSSLDIEGEGSSRKVIKDLINRKSIPKNENEQKALNIYSALSYIDTAKPLINKENIMLIYKMLVQNLSSEEDHLEDNNDYRQSEEDGYVNEFKTPNQKTMRKGMESLLRYINSDQMNDYIIEKSLIIQIVFIYFHPFYDFNGRMGRIMTYWFLSLHGKDKVKNIIYLSLPLHKNKYLMLWNEFRKMKWNDLTTFMNFLGLTTSLSAEKIIIINKIALNNGYKFNETETLLLFYLIDQRNWIQANHFIKKIDLGITKQGIRKSLSNLRDRKIIKIKIEKNTWFIRTNYTYESIAQPNIKTFLEFYFDNKGKQNITIPSKSDNLE